VSRTTWIVVAAGGVVLVGAATGEHLYRRIVERRCQQAVWRSAQLEARYAQALTTHDRLTWQLAQAQHRAQELEQALEAKHAQLQEAVGRLTEEAQTVRELEIRLSAMQQQMDQLQGELVLALQHGGETPGVGEGAAVELERIIVADAQNPGPQGRIVSVHEDWGFVVMDLGWDAVKIGDTVSILRNDELLAKARVERVQAGVSAATLLPEWEGAGVHVNDLVRIL
jgi:hypothetical protein